MPNHVDLVVFALGEHLYALPCLNVRRIHHIVEITPIPNAPSDVLGIVNVQGEIIHIIDIRRCLGLSQKTINLKDYIVVVDSSSIPVGFVANDIDFMSISNEDIQRRKEMSVVKLNTGLAHIIDVEALLQKNEYEIFHLPKAADLNEMNTGI